MTPKRKGWGPEYHPSYKSRLPQPMVVVLREEDGSILETFEVAEYGWELTQEVLAVVFGQAEVHKGSYIEIRTEEYR